MVSVPSGQQNKGSSCSILGLPGGFMAQLSLLPHFWHPDLGSWVVLLHSELCFLALELGDYCLQFPFVGCFKSSSEPEGGTNPSLGCFCEPQNACETKEGATWNGNWGGTDREKSPTHSPRKRQESREVCLFQLSAFLQSSDNFIYCVLILTSVEPGVCCDPMVFGQIGKNTLFHVYIYIFIHTHKPFSQDTLSVHKAFPWWLAFSSWVTDGFLCRQHRY